MLDRFTEVGLIDDAAFARAWVSSRQAGRGLARRALRAELRAKGVDGEVAAEAVDAVDDDDEREAARRLVERKVRRRCAGWTASPPTRRLMGMLARKGYGGGLAGYVVREALDADGAAEDAAAEAEPVSRRPDSRDPTGRGPTGGILDSPARSERCRPAKRRTGPGRAAGVDRCPVGRAQGPVGGDRLPDGVAASPRWGRAGPGPSPRAAAPGPPVRGEDLP